MYHKYDEEPDYYYEDDGEYVVDLYYDVYRRFLSRVEKRVKFTELEWSKLGKADCELHELNEKEMALSHYILDYDSVDIYIEKSSEILGEFETRRQNIFNSVERLLQVAHRRFFKKNFGEKAELVIEDALRVYDLIRHDPSFIIDIRYLRIEQSKRTIYKWYYSLLQNIPFHFSYLSELGKLDILLDQFTSYIHPNVDKESQLNYSQLKKEFIEVYKTHNDYGFQISRFAPPLANFKLVSQKDIEDINDNHAIITIRKNGLTLFINNVEKEVKFRTSTFKLLDHLIYLGNESGFSSNEISINVVEYTGLKVLSSTTKELQSIYSDLRTLCNIRFSYERNSGKSRRNGSIEYKIIDSYKKSRKGRVIATLSQEFVDELRNFPIMQFSKKLFALNEALNPNSYNLLIKLLWHRDINHRHANVNVISVLKLLEACPNIPKYSDIVNSGQIWQRIIEPFERDLNAIGDVLEWCYSRKGKDLDFRETRDMDYSLFSELMIRVNWIDYPNNLTSK